MCVRVLLRWICFTSLIRLKTVVQRRLQSILCEVVPKVSVVFGVSAEGFQSWMWRGLTFLLPFLFFGHVSQKFFIPLTINNFIANISKPKVLHKSFMLLVKVHTSLVNAHDYPNVCVLWKTSRPLLWQFWQLYNSVTLFRLAGHEDCKEWQVGTAL